MIRDNRSYLIKEIKQETEKQIDALKAEHKASLAKLRKEYKADYEPQLASLESSLEKQRTDFIRQQENMIKLKKDHVTLQAEMKLVRQITDEVKKKLLTKPMMQAIVDSLGNVDNIEVPEGSDFKGKVRADNKVVALLSGHIIEFDIDEFLENQKGLIYSVVRENL